jgi:hypothetical protein
VGPDVEWSGVKVMGSLSECTQRGEVTLQHQSLHQAVCGRTTQQQVHQQTELGASEQVCVIAQRLQ